MPGDTGEILVMLRGHRTMPGKDAGMVCQLHLLAFTA